MLLVSELLCHIAVITGMGKQCRFNFYFFFQYRFLLYLFQITKKKKKESLVILTTQEMLELEAMEIISLETMDAKCIEYNQINSLLDIL